MEPSDVTEILRLPVEERLRIMEQIWESLAAEPSRIPIGDAHRRVIDERLTEHEARPDDVITHDEVLSRARRR